MNYTKNGFFPIYLLILSVLLLTLETCKEEKIRKAKFEEGSVKYEISYIENNMEKSIPTNLLPQHMILKFQGSKSIRYLEGFMGLFSFKVITDHNQKKSITLLKVIDKKYYHEGEENAPLFCFSGIPGMKIELENGTKNIAGALCKKGRVTFPDNENKESFPIYYTNDISLQNPNFGNPYSKIDGVLLKFQMRFHKLRMELKAKEIKNHTISKKEFKIPEEFKKVSEDNMQKIFASLME